MLKKFIRWLDDWFEEVFVSIMLALLIAMLGTEVFSRFVIGKSITWIEELCHYLFIWSSYIGIAVAIKRKEQIRILCLVDFMRKVCPAAVKWMYLASELSFAAFCLYVVYISKGMMDSMVMFPQVSGALEIDMIYAYAIIPASMILVAFRTFQRVWRDWKEGTMDYVNNPEG